MSQNGINYFLEIFFVSNLRLSRMVGFNKNRTVTEKRVVRRGLDRPQPFSHFARQQMEAVCKDRNLRVQCRYLRLNEIPEIDACFL